MFARDQSCGRPLTQSVLSGQKFQIPGTVPPMPRYFRLVAVTLSFILVVYSTITPTKIGVHEAQHMPISFFPQKSSSVFVLSSWAFSQPHLPSAYNRMLLVRCVKNQHVKKVVGGRLSMLHNHASSNNIFE